MSFPGFAPQPQINAQLNPGNLTSLNLPNIQAQPGASAPVAQPLQTNPMQQFQNMQRQQALAQALMGQQSPAVTPLQAAANAGSQMAGAWGDQNMQARMNAFLQQHPEILQRRQDRMDDRQNPQMPGQPQQGFWGRLGSMFGPGGGQTAQPLAGGPNSPAALPNQGMGVQLGPQNSMPRTIPQSY